MYIIIIISVYRVILDSELNVYRRNQGVSITVYIVAPPTICGLTRLYIVV